MIFIYSTQSDSDWEQEQLSGRAAYLWLKGLEFESWQEFSSLRSTFCADSYFSICSTPVLLQ